MKSAVVLSVLTALAGCATDRPGGAAGRVVGDADRVSVAGSRWDALPLAVIHCSRFQKSAIFDREQDGRSVFRCVVKP